MSPTDAAPTPRRRLRFGLWLGLTGLPGLLLGTLLALSLAVGLWAGRDGSLPQALGWLQALSEHHPDRFGRLSVEQAQGSLLGGGRIGELRWAHQGLTVHAQALSLRLEGITWRRLLAGQGLWLPHLHLERLEIDDRRPPSPMPPAPPASVALPLDLDLPFSLDALVLRAQNLTLRSIRAHYHHAVHTDPGRRAQGHALRLDGLAFADGRYEGELQLGSGPGLPLTLHLRGEVHAPWEGRTIKLPAQARVEGSLAGEQARLQAELRLQAESRNGALPELQAQATLAPWAPMPLQSLQLQAQALDLAWLWPAAPRTRLDGRAQVDPDGPGWRASLSLDNAQPGPLDSDQLPLTQLQAEGRWQPGRWRLDRLDARLPQGRLQAQGWLEPATPSGPPRWHAQARLQGMNPATVWSSLPADRWDGSLAACQPTLARADEPPPRAQAAAAAMSPAPTSEPKACDPVDAAAAGRTATALPTLTAQLRATDPKAANEAGLLRLQQVELRARWQPMDPAHASHTSHAGRILFDTVQLQAAGLRLEGQGQLDLDRRRIEGRLDAQVPGLRLQWEGHQDAEQGRGALGVDLEQAPMAWRWLAQLAREPLLTSALTPLLQVAPAPSAGQAHLDLRWDGGWRTLLAPGPSGPALAWQATLDLPQWQPARPAPSQPDPTPPTTLRLERVQLALQGQGPRAQADLRGTLETSGGQVAAQLQTEVEWDLGAARARLNLSKLALDLAQPNRAERWHIGLSSPQAISWGRADGLRMGAGGLDLRRQGPSSQSADTPPPSPVTLRWDGMRWQAGAWQTTGQLKNLPLSWLDAWARPPGDPSLLAQAGVDGELWLDGHWQIDWSADPATSPRLHARVQRSRGDLGTRAETAPGGGTAARVQAGLREASLSLDAADGALAWRLRWDSERLGQLDAELTSPLAPPDALHPGWHWPQQAPLRGTVRGRWPELGVWSALAPPGWRLAGRVQTDIQIGGTRARPLWLGELRAHDMALRSTLDGLAFQDGELQARFDGDRLRLDRLQLAGAGGAGVGGLLQAHGELALGPDGRPGDAALTLDAQALRVSARADRRLTLSGQLEARLSAERLHVRGRLRADAARFVLPDDLTPRLGDDVVQRHGGEAAVPVRESRVRPDVRIELNLGPRFEVAGLGLQAQLGGEISLVSTPQQPTPRVLGEVRTVRGEYRAYGQRLSLETGVLRFTGPYDDPVLDIVAVRPQTSQRVGVQVRGSAQAPVVRLFAEPELPDSEKLAWLVLGRPATGAGAEAAVLQQAALALLAGRGDGLSGGLAGAFGLDELSLRGGVGEGTEATALTLGKRLSNRLYLGYERTLTSTTGTVSIFYDVSRRLTVRARAGEENAIDLVLTLQHD